LKLYRGICLSRQADWKDCKLDVLVYRFFMQLGLTGDFSSYFWKILIFQSTGQYSGTEFYLVANSVSVVPTQINTIAFYQDFQFT